jgi:hypothetical protein
MSGDRKLNCEASFHPQETWTIPTPQRDVDQ